jgi:hypothetical protein
MKAKLAVLFVAAIASLSLGASRSSAGDRCASGGIEFTPEPGFTGSLTVDTGGYSQSTGEYLLQSGAHLVARVEQANGSVHPLFGANPHHVLVFKTTGGHYVVRLLIIPHANSE